MRSLALLSTIFALAVTASVPKAPSMPPHFTMKWTIMAVDDNNAPPPYKPVPKVPYKSGNGKTFYDSKLGNMLEVYEDFCVPIFEGGNNFKCNFLNVNGTAYLISSHSQFPPCCIFSPNFNPPAPDFLAKAKVPFNQTTTLYGNKVDWWVMDGNDPAEPFGYGFYRKTFKDHPQLRIPASFWFRSFGGWTSQEFHNMKVVVPSQDVWVVPSTCNNAPSCNFFK
eukprot:TRINITY_DN4879_c0_g1_i1.p1 TRINITY_DN4879_c0_g1~~TRINITY_DN4879_c0_g1_i1.p1  ORF type:complete len:223 (-),score=46.03 TRINITY_DN4879_c0_g1_i1:152-820(-)